MANTSGTSGMTTPTPAAGGGPGPAPGGGIEEGVSGLLWVISLTPSQLHHFSIYSHEKMLCVDSFTGRKRFAIDVVTIGTRSRFVLRVGMRSGTQSADSDPIWRYQFRLGRDVRFGFGGESRAGFLDLFMGSTVETSALLQRISAFGSARQRVNYSPGGAQSGASRDSLPEIALHGTENGVPSITSRP